MNLQNKMNPMLLPRPLKKGDLLGVIAPAGMLHDEALFHSGIEILSEMGFEVKFPRELWPGVDYLADSDENRATELNELFRDSEVKAIVSMRGGYGCLRILDRINLDIIANNPKFLIGFSDITVLQQYLYFQTGLVSLHGPTLTSLSRSTQETLEKFRASLLGLWNEPVCDKKIVQLQGSGCVAAPLIGGNLASLTTLLGTKYDSDWSDRIIFLEDVNEPIYKIDRMITQLAAAGKFEKVRGIILGNFASPKNETSLNELRYKESVWTRVLEVCPDKNIPVWGDFPSGHCTHNITFPIGAIATMDCSKCRVAFD